MDQAQVGVKNLSANLDGMNNELAKLLAHYFMFSNGKMSRSYRMCWIGRLLDKL